MGPDTGRLRFFSSAFKSATFISSRFPVSFGRLRALAGIDVSAFVDCLGATGWVGLGGGGGGAGGAGQACRVAVLVAGKIDSGLNDVCVTSVGLDVNGWCSVTAWTILLLPTTAG